MPVIQIVPDRFKEREKVLAPNSAPGSSTSGNHIRRPVRGIVIKDDTFATLRVEAGNGKVVPIIDAGSRRINPESKDKEKPELFKVGDKIATDIYSNFFIQQVNEERAEKQQILETFGEPFIFLFGERARIVSFQGVLLNTFDFNWEAEWWYNYDNYIRGTRCVENDARVFISFDETLVTGYIIASSAVKSAEQRNVVQFQFQMFVTSYTNFSKIGNPNALPGLKDDDVGKEKRQTAADLNPFRPTLIDTSTQTGRMGPRPVTPSGTLAEFSLADGLAANVARISQTFNSIKNQAETTIKRLSDLANGTVVRVPIGFAGALEFDDSIDVQTLQTGNDGGVIKYSTFRSNEDEYVGASDHYGSAVRLNGAVRVDEDINGKLTRDSKMVEKAEEIWEAAGYRVPDNDSSAVSQLLVKGGFGLTAIGSNELWKSKLVQNSPAISSLSPIRVPRGPALVEE